MCAVLADCNADEERHNRLLQLCGKVSGRSRSILSSDPSGMDMPIRIDDGLFFEGKFDTEYLIKMMTERVLDKVGYDYSGIRIAIRNRPTRVLEPEEPKRTEDPSTDGERSLALECGCCKGKDGRGSGLPGNRPRRPTCCPQVPLSAAGMGTVPGEKAQPNLGRL